MWYAYAFGFGYAIIVGYLLIEPVMLAIWKYREEVPGALRVPGDPQPALIGVIERILYISSLLMDHGEFIGFWLALKMAGHLWGKERTYRILYMDTLIGNAISLLYAGVGFQMISWIESEKWFYASIVPSLLILGTYYLYQYLKKHAKKSQKS